MDLLNGLAMAIAVHPVSSLLKNITLVVMDISYVLVFQSQHRDTLDLWFAVKAPSHFSSSDFASRCPLDLAAYINGNKRNNT